MTVDDTYDSDQSRLLFAIQVKEKTYMHNIHVCNFEHYWCFCLSEEPKNGHGHDYLFLFFLISSSDHEIISLKQNNSLFLPVNMISLIHSSKNTLLFHIPSTHSKYLLTLNFFSQYHKTTFLNS